MQKDKENSTLEEKREIERCNLINLFHVYLADGDCNGERFREASTIQELRTEFEEFPQLRDQI